MTELAIQALDELLCVGDGRATKEKILAYEVMAKVMPQVDIPVKSTMHGGMYAREITIPKGTFLTGAIYKFDHLDIMISGDITVTTDDGERKRFTGYNFFEGLSGKKRAGYAHEDTTWIGIHPVVGDDPEEVQKFLTVETFEELAEFEEEVKLWLE